MTLELKNKIFDISAVEEKLNYDYFFNFTPSDDDIINNLFLIANDKIKRLDYDFYYYIIIFYCYYKYSSHHCNIMKYIIETEYLNVYKDIDIIIYVSLCAYFNWLSYQTLGRIGTYCNCPKKINNEIVIQYLNNNLKVANIINDKIKNINKENYINQYYEIEKNDKENFKIKQIKNYVLKNKEILINSNSDLKYFVFKDIIIRYIWHNIPIQIKKNQDLRKLYDNSYGYERHFKIQSDDCFKNAIFFVDNLKCCNNMLENTNIPELSKKIFNLLKHSECNTFKYLFDSKSELLNNDEIKIILLKIFNIKIDNNDNIKDKTNEMIEKVFSALNSEEKMKIFSIQFVKNKYYYIEQIISSDLFDNNKIKQAFINIFNIRNIDDNYELIKQIFFSNSFSDNEFKKIFYILFNTFTIDKLCLSEEFINIFENVFVRLFKQYDRNIFLNIY